MTPKQIEAAYKTFIQDTGNRCWRCGRTDRDRPAWWHAPFLIERAHIVNKPRRQDRRCVVALCSLCHRLQHSDTFYATYDLSSRQRFPLCTNTSLTLDELLNLKANCDPEYFDQAFLQTCSVKRLPEIGVDAAKLKA